MGRNPVFCKSNLTYSNQSEKSDAMYKASLFDDNFDVLHKVVLDNEEQNAIYHAIVDCMKELKVIPAQADAFTIEECSYLLMINRELKAKIDEVGVTVEEETKYGITIKANPLINEVRSNDRLIQAYFTQLGLTIGQKGAIINNAFNSHSVNGQIIASEDDDIY